LKERDYKTALLCYIKLNGPNLTTVLIIINICWDLMFAGQQMLKLTVILVVCDAM
jgi:hypothetical protein